VDIDEVFHKTMRKKLDGLRAIITGGTQGLGRAIMEEFLREGAKVVFCGRSVDLVRKTEEDLNASHPGKVRGYKCDVGLNADVASFAEAAQQWLGGVEVLVNNAGVLGPLGPATDVSWEEWQETLNINLLGTVRMCRALVPTMQSAGRGKIINLSGGGATNGRPRFSAYATSKAAVVRFTETLAMELADSGIGVNAVAPGLLKTRMIDQLFQAGEELAGEKDIKDARRCSDTGGTPLDLGARLCVFLASSASDGITGKLISAPWDPWEDLPSHREDLQKTDVYTLRRITPKDRGMTWDPKADL
jgi:NAD(P)-dependent dehydrogenase (short-subunit alcohol dehydrogenase family)